MTNKINNNLHEIAGQIDQMVSQIGVSKKGLADALRFNGISNVSDTETFARYAYLIRRLKSVNAMILQFTIPENAQTAYKRTVVLPMVFKQAGNNGLDLNTIAKTVIANDNGVYNTLSELSLLSLDDGEEDSPENHKLLDIYGNEIVDGTYVAPFTMEDVHQYLTEEQSEELLTSMNNLGISLMSLAGEDEIFEPDATATYSYTVDWGDNSGEYIYDSTKTAEENADAIYHTYRRTGTYDVTINGVFKRICTQGDDAGFLENGTVLDADGTYKILNNYNNAMINYLVAVIAWGNTMLNNMADAFRRCTKLATIPMYDTTNSFEEVTNFSCAFRRCYSLKSLPFNSNTNKGLFSGSSKATNFANCFEQCTGLTGSIPPKLIDGCPNVVTTASMFSGCTGITGKIPVDMVKGLTKLENASNMFYNCSGIVDTLTPGLFDTCPNIKNIGGMYRNCSKLYGNVPAGMFTGVTTLTDVGGLFGSCTGLNGEIPNDLFKDCVNITNMAEVFYNCYNITGVIKKGAFSNLKRLTSMQRAFRYCRNITGFETGAFENTGMDADNLNCFEAFEGCHGINEIAENVLDMKGKNIRLDRMFASCNGITTIQANNLDAVSGSVADARGMFGGCVALATVEDTGNTSKFVEAKANGDVDNVIKRWYGAFANTSVTNPNIPLEMGVLSSERADTTSEIGKIVLSDRSTKEVKEYVYDKKNPPIAIVYADIYIDPTVSVSTIANGKGNVVSKDTPGAVRKIYASVLNDTTKQWTNGQVNAEDITTITNTSDVNVAYNRYKLDTNTGKYVLNPTRYNGEAYSKAINEWRKEKGYIDYVIDKTTGKITSYERRTSDKYDAMEYCMTYNLNGSQWECFFPDAADLWTQYLLRDMQEAAIKKIRQSGDGKIFTDKNTNSLRTGTLYWASAEYYQTYAWGCYTGGAGCSTWGTKWVSCYVRPSLAIKA